MSASLVGSEMCIRDSHPTHDPCAQSSRPHTRATPYRNATYCFYPGCRICLLYTSDAADDM
eukprot:9870158-Alexandrium_andersonii.AAC.1